MSDKNADLITDPGVAEQAFWTIPGTSVRVVYSLPLFHDIDFAVNEGYRKIPHGGIEVGGLLFGSLNENGAAIEAFRGIECEHVFGPSFLLSDRDINVLEAQIKATASDPELQGLQLVGWFLAHTRGPLQLTDPELELSDRFFRTPGQLTVLVKPERFQPTLFGFLVRDASGNMSRDASQHAIILPLPGRSSRSTASGPAPSLMAPKTSGVPRRPVRPSPIEPEVKTSPAAEEPVEERESAPVEESSMTAGIRAARRRLKFEEARLLAERDEELAAGSKPESAKPTLEAPESDPSNALVSVKKKRAHAPEPPAPDYASQNLYPELEDLAKPKPPATSSKLKLVLPLAALIGSVVGYVAYLQIPSPIIPLNAHGQAESVLISWPPNETRNAVYAAIRVDDSAPVPLSPEEKASGKLELSATPDMKIELITRNWLRDSRGIVRFVKAENPQNNAAAPE